VILQPTQQQHSPFQYWYHFG